MKFRQLTPEIGSVSEIGMGTWQLGVNSGWRDMTEKETMDMVHAALDMGVNFFDTAPNYGLGTSEQRLGKALKNVGREQVVINTKVGHSAEGIFNFEARQLRKSLEGSLKRLQTDYVDSLILHNPPKELLDGGKSPHFGILEGFKEEGLIRAYGASLDTYEEMELLMETTNAEVIEAFFNILHQDTAKAFSLAQDSGVGIIAKIPLDSGWLTGKYGPDSTFDGVRSRWSRSDIETRAALVEEVRNMIGDEFDLPQAAISFCLAYDAVATAIPGNASIDQLRQNVMSAEHPLTNDLVEKLVWYYKDKVKNLKLPW